MDFYKGIEIETFTLSLIKKFEIYFCLKTTAEHVLRLLFDKFSNMCMFVSNFVIVFNSLLNKFLDTSMKCQRSWRIIKFNLFKKCSCQRKLVAIK